MKRIINIEYCTIFFQILNRKKKKNEKRKKIKLIDTQKKNATKKSILLTCGHGLVWEVSAALAAVAVGNGRTRHQTELWKLPELSSEVPIFYLLFLSFFLDDFFGGGSLALFQFLRGALGPPPPSVVRFFFLLSRPPDRLHETLFFCGVFFFSKYKLKEKKKKKDYGKTMLWERPKMSGGKKGQMLPFIKYNNTLQNEDVFVFQSSGIEWPPPCSVWPWASLFCQCWFLWTIWKACTLNVDYIWIYFVPFFYFLFFFERRHNCSLSCTHTQKSGFRLRKAGFPEYWLHAIVMYVFTSEYKNFKKKIRKIPIVSTESYGFEKRRVNFCFLNP